MKKIIGVLAMAFCLFFSLSVSAQQEARFKVELSSDSVLMGNYFIVKFTLENGEGKEFQPPTFSGFDVVGGPNYSSSLSMINGEVSQSLSYTYFLKPKDIGNFYIEAASIHVGENVLETSPVEMMVVPNPDGIIQNPDEPEQSGRFGEPDLFPWGKELPKTTPQKKKRRTYKI